MTTWSLPALTRRSYISVLYERRFYGALVIIWMDCVIPGVTKKIYIDWALKFAKT